MCFCTFFNLTLSKFEPVILVCSFQWDIGFFFLSIPLYASYLFPLIIFQFFLFITELSKLMTMGLVIISFMFLVLQGHRTSWIYGLTVFIKDLKIFNYFYFKYFFCLPSHALPSESSVYIYWARNYL